MLEREVIAIKDEIAQIKSAYWTREEARLLDAGMSRMDRAIEVLQADVAQLKIDVAQLKRDVAQRPAGVTKIRVELASIRARMDQLVSKAELHQMEARLKAWMLGSVISIIGVTASIQFALYAGLRS